MADTLTTPLPFAQDLDRAAARHAGEPAWLTELRESAAAILRQHGFPTMQDENFRYTDVRPVTEGAFTVVDEENAKSSLTVADLAPYLWNLPKSVRLVFVDGFFQEHLSDLSASTQGLTVLPLRRAIRENAPRIQEMFVVSQEREPGPFVHLNAALMSGGVFIHARRGAASEVPIHLVHLTTPGTRKATFCRHLFLADEASAFTVVESHFDLPGAQGNYTNVVLEAHLEPGCNIDHYRLQIEDEQTALHTSQIAVRQDRDSVFRSHTITLGGRLVRNEYITKLDGQHCEAIINGLFLTRGTQHVDNHMWVEHCQENIPSHELFKGILADNSTGVFTGRIYVHPEAQKTDAKQTSQNLLLSPTARITTKPQLEIYADDVKCTHGATIGQLDETAIFYLRTRGLNTSDARKVLVQAFAGDITERIRIPELREGVEALITERLQAILATVA